MKKIFTILCLIVLSCSLWTANIFAEAPPSDEEPNQPASVRPILPGQHKIAGTWLGNLDALGIKYMIILRIHQNVDSTLSATLYCPGIGMKDTPVEKITFEEDNLRFDVNDPIAVFDGQITTDGSTIEGQWKQSGFVFPLIVRRVSEAELNKLLEDKSYTKVFEPAKLKQDLDFLFQTIKEVHPNMYAYISRQEFSKFRDQLYKQISQPMTRLKFYKAVAPVVASLKNGHTFMQLPRGAFAEYLQKGGKIFPLEFHWDGTRVILKGCIYPNDLPIGGEILSIDYQDAKEFLVKTARYSPDENKAYNLGVLEYGNILPMFLWLEKGNAESLALRTKSFAGTVKEYTVKSLSQKQIENETATDRTEYAPTSSKKSPAYSYRYIPEYNAGLIEFNSFVDLEKFKKFLSETFKTLREQKADNLIIDIRKNSGGSSSLGDELLKYLTDKPFRQFEKIQLKISKQMCKQYKSLGGQAPDGKIGSLKSSYIGFFQPGDNTFRFKGRIFVLIGPITASSAMSFAQTAKHFDIGTLIGQETGDTPVNYGEIIRASLPNTGLGFSVACKRFVCAGAKADGRGVSPDYEVKQKPEDTAKGVDTVLEFTLNLIKSSEAKE